MRIDRFHMERTQCLYENEVRYNLSESGVQPLRVEELLAGEEGRAELLGQSLKYPESNGSRLLRERIALFYPGATADNVLVTTGTSEANYTALWGLLEKGDRAAIMIPTYMQAWGLARAYAGRADAYRLVEKRDGAERRWALDVASLDRAVTRKTRLILVTNPNNPTGAVLSEEEMDEIVRVARKAGAWIVADEVYRGAEVQGDAPTPTFWGRYRKIICTAGLSKAFGLPGLRIGWIVGPPKTVAALWGYQDYTTLTPTMLSDRLARAAMEPRRREEILARTRAILRRQLPPVEAWVRRHDDVLDLIPPLAGAIALVKYSLPVGSVAFLPATPREVGADHPGGTLRHREIHPDRVRLRPRKDPARAVAGGRDSGRVGKFRKKSCETGRLIPVWPLSGTSGQQLLSLSDFRAHRGRARSVTALTAGR